MLAVETRPSVPVELRGKVDVERATWVRVLQDHPLWRPLRSFLARYARQSFEVEQVVPRDNVLHFFLLFPLASHGTHALADVGSAASQGRQGKAHLLDHVGHGGRGG